MPMLTQFHGTFSGNGSGISFYAAKELVAEYLKELNQDTKVRRSPGWLHIICVCVSLYPHLSVGHRVDIMCIRSSSTRFSSRVYS